MPVLEEHHETAWEPPVEDPVSNAIVKQPGKPLAPAVVVDPASVPAEIRAKIKELMRPDPARFLIQLALAWGSIVAAICVAEYLGSIWATVPAVFFIATRQNVLGLLMHEQCHRLAFRSKLGDRLCNLAIAYPLLVTLEGYRRVHIAHHQNYFTERDPDYRRKQGPEWTFPQRVSRLLRSFTLDLFGLSVFETVRGKNAESAQAIRSRSKFDPLLRGLFYVSLTAVVIATGQWRVFLVYWLLPLATVLQLIVRWGAICEHKYDLVHPSVPESTPIIEPRWWENILLPNLNFTLHIYHHWYPRVPFARLPEVHKLFRAATLVRDERVFRGYSGYLAFLLRGSLRSQR